MSEYPVPTVVRRHRRSRVEVAQIAASYAQSGLSRSEFCRQHDLSLSTLSRYCPHARRHRDALPRASMSKSLSAAELPLARVEFVEKSATHTEQHDPLLVELAGGRRIAVSAGFDAATLTRLIAVLEQA
jgi:transposase-like protein